MLKETAALPERWLIDMFEIFLDDALAEEEPLEAALERIEYVLLRVLDHSDFEEKYLPCLRSFDQYLCWQMPSLLEKLPENARPASADVPWNIASIIVHHLEETETVHRWDFYCRIFWNHFENTPYDLIGALAAVDSALQFCVQASPDALPQKEGDPLTVLLRWLDISIDPDLAVEAVSSYWGDHPPVIVQSWLQLDEEFPETWTEDELKEKIRRARRHLSFLEIETAQNVMAYLRHQKDHLLVACHETSVHGHPTDLEPGSWTYVPGFAEDEPDEEFEKRRYAALLTVESSVVSTFLTDGIILIALQKSDRHLSMAGFVIHNHSVHSLHPSEMSEAVELSNLPPEMHLDFYVPDIAVY